MNEIVVGKLLTGTEKKDAIHFALMPMVATCRLNAGEHVSANGDENKPYVGIVDPFLKEFVEQGERFWLFLYPNTVIGMRHEWQHPAFPEATGDASIVKDPEGFHRQTLESVASQIGCSFSSLVERLELYGDDSCGGDDGIQEGLNQLANNPSAIESMWNSYEALYGRVKTRVSGYFHCAC